MSEEADFQFDEIGYWSELKLDIIKEYAKAYSIIMSAPKQRGLYHMYIDGFAGGGIHLSKRSGEFVKGSPLNALDVIPPFKEYHFVELNPKKKDFLARQLEGRENVFIYEGDCNEILVSRIFPMVRYNEYKRALCLLDPYGLHLKWEVMATAGHANTVDLILNFPIMDMNRNALWRNPEKVSMEQAVRMNVFWGDDSWRNAVYQREPSLFGDIDTKRQGNEAIVEAFRARLKEQGGFKVVPEPLPIRIGGGAIVYYLFFASQKEVAGKIAKGIMSKYGERGA